MRVASAALLLAAVACGEGEPADDDLTLLHQTATSAAPTAAGGTTSSQSAITSNSVTAAELTSSVTARMTISGGEGCGTRVGGFFTRDRRELTLGFEVNELNMTKTQARVDLRCTVGVILESGVPVSFAVSRLYAQGYTVMEAGMRAQLALQYRDPLGAWHGPTQRDVDGANELHSFRLDQRHPDETLVWSRCGTRGEIALQTAFTMRNGSPRGEGTVDMCSTDVGGIPSSQAGLTFLWRACEPDAAAERAQ